LQLDHLERANHSFAASLRRAEDASAPFEAALTMKGFAVAARAVDNPHADAFEAEAARILERLAVIALAVPAVAGR
jgi:hypothetical protein